MNLMNKKLNLTDLEHEDWFPSFSRELDLVIAANVEDSAIQKKTLYNSDLNNRVSEYCRPLDGGYEESYLGIIKVEPVSEDIAYKRVDIALEALKGRPRGHWAILELDGRYDAFMSDGIGGFGTESGHKFTARSADSDGFSADHLYGNVLSWIVYNRRREIEAEMLRHTVESAKIPEGHVWRDVRSGGTTYSKVTYLGPGDVPGQHRIGLSRRGLKATTGMMPDEGIARLADLRLEADPKYWDMGNDLRLRTLRENREDVAINMLRELLDDNTVERFMKAEGDMVYCMYDPSRGKTAGRFIVEFANVGCDPISAGVFDEDGNQITPSVGNVPR